MNGKLQAEDTSRLEVVVRFEAITDIFDEPAELSGLP